MFKKYLEVKNNGVFAKIDIPAKSPIIEIPGKVLLASQLTSIPDPNDCLQIGPNTFLAPSGDMTDHLNHNCDPNCYVQAVGNRGILYSLYVITAGSELTIDYSVTSTDTLDSWQMNCECNSNKCRKIISGFQYLSKETKDRYENKDMVPIYITHNIIQPR